MSLITGILASVIVIWIVLRTMSFAVWNWRNENITGSVMIIILCIASVAVPVYVVFFKT
jgi:hypothetical protein